MRLYLGILILSNVLVSIFYWIATLFCGDTKEMVNWNMIWTMVYSAIYVGVWLVEPYCK